MEQEKTTTNQNGELEGKTRVSMEGVPETMLQTLYARAAETEKEKPAIRDEKAVEIVKRLDYDFSLAKRMQRWAAA